LNGGGDGAFPSRKHPFAHRIGFGSASALFTIKESHHAHIEQIGGNGRGVIAGAVHLEMDANSRTNTGSILNCGQITIRCMPHLALVL
jgi:hypothetical protein